LLFIFCNLKALPNIKLIKKSHRAIIKKNTTPEPPQQQNTVWAYSRKYPLQHTGKTTANA
jgi:hypothetical protein